jgi:hypothetical protein
MVIEMVDCTGTLLREIAMPESTRNSVAQTYALAMKSSEPTDWPAVNRAIIARWSLSALEHVKKLAWSGKCWPAETEPAS